MGMFDVWKFNKEVNEKRRELREREEELEMKEAEFQEHHSCMMELKSILESLGDFEEKYVGLCPTLDSPLKEDGSVDYSRMGEAYRKHLLELKETVFASYNLSRIPRTIREISRNVEKDNRRLDKKDLLEVRELINQQLDELESLCCDDYDSVSMNVSPGFGDSKQEVKVG